MSRLIYDVSPAMFALFYGRARSESSLIAENTSPYDHHDGTRYRLATDGLGNRWGYAVRADGELVFVFSTVKGRGDEIVRSAIEAGAVYLDCFDGHLPTLYARHGFVEVARVPNWNPEGPDVVYMSLPGFESRHGF